MNIQDNICRYTHINSSIYVLQAIVNEICNDTIISLEELQIATDRTYLYINSSDNLYGIIGSIPKNIEDEDIKEYIPKMKIYPKGKEIYLIKFIYAQDDPIDGISSYHIYNQLIKQGTITLGDRPVFIITNETNFELINALKANRFIQYKDGILKNKNNIFVQYPKGIIDNETPKELYYGINEL